MKNSFIAFVLAFVLLSTTGCSSYFKRSHTSIKDKNGNPIGTIFVWEADSNAAMLNATGKVCMQNALAIKTSDSSASAKLSEAILNLVKISTTESFGGNSSNSNSEKLPLADLTATIKQTATMLTTTTERTSFLNTGLFYICQLSANKSMSDADTNEVTNTLIMAAAGLGNPETVNDKIDSDSKNSTDKKSIASNASK